MLQSVKVINLFDQNFVGMGSIKIYSNKESDPFTECVFDQRDANLFRNRIIVHFGQAHTPESQLGNLTAKNDSHKTRKIPTQSHDMNEGYKINPTT